MLLREIVYQRTGDKGKSVEISLIPHKNVKLEQIKPLLNEDNIRQHFSDYSIECVSIKIYETLNLIQIVLTGILNGGVSLNNRIDRHGKSLGDILLEFEMIKIK